MPGIPMDDFDTIIAVEHLSDDELWDAYDEMTQMFYEEFKARGIIHEDDCEFLAPLEIH